MNIVRDLPSMSSRFALGLIICFTVAFTGIFLFQTRELNFRLSSDYDSNLPMYEFIMDYVHTTHSFPLWNPYVSAGVSTLGDPLLAIGNPFVCIPMYMFGVPAGMRIVIIESILIAGLSFWLFSSRCTRSIPLRVWGSILYEISGAGIARISAGHIEQLVAFSILPILFYFLFQKKISIKQSMLMGIGVSLLWYSGAVYDLFYVILLAFVIRSVYIIKEKIPLSDELRVACSLLLVACLLSVPKLYSFITSVLPVFRREITDNTRGSLHLYLFPVQFMMPFTVWFYDRPTIQRLFGYYYNWYEYYAFVSPFPFVLFLKYKKIIHDNMFRIVALVLLAGAFFISERYVYSPFYWLNSLFQFLHVFRTPQRMYLPLTSLCIGLFLIAGNYWIRQSQTLKEKLVLFLICFSTIVCTGLVSYSILLQETFESKALEPVEIATVLRQQDPTDFFVVSFIARTQWSLIKEHIPVANYYYGWENKTFPHYTTDPSFLASDEFKQHMPKYIIAPTRGLNLITYGYVPYMQSDSWSIWKTERPTIVPEIRYE